MSEIKIKGREDGPYMIPGKAIFVASDGTEQVTRGETVHLCRCGGSQNKPFCDGTHRKISFKAVAVELNLTEK